MPDGVTTATTVGEASSIAGIGLIYTGGSLGALMGTFDHNGNQITVPVANCSTVQITPTQYDLNGNCIALGSFTDTLGETPLTISLATNPSNTSPTFLSQAPVDQSLTYSYAGGGTSGTSETILHYTPHSLTSNFQCPNIAETSGPGQSQLGSFGLTLLPDKLTLPDGRYYSFTYESIRDIPGSTTGRIASITFPAGGSVSYSYGPVNCLDGSVLSLTRTVDDGNGNVSTWSYSRSQGQPILDPYGANVAPWTTVITDPSFNQQVLSFKAVSPLPPQFLSGFPPDGVGDSYPTSPVLNFYETSRVEYSGAAMSGTAMRTTLTSYNNNWTTTLPITSHVVTTKLPDASGKTSQIAETYDTMGNLTQRSTYDYGAIGAGVGPLLYTESTGYQNFAGIYEFPTNMVDKNGIQTVISYDDTTPKVTSGVAQHSSVGPHLGNPTRVYKPQGISIRFSPLVSKYTYYDTGVVDTSTDSTTGAVTTYTYSDCASAFPISTSTPVTTPGSSTSTATLTTSTTYDCKGGVPLTATDINGNATTVAYNDPLWRPTLVTDASGNTVAQAYPTPQSALSTTTTTYNDPTPRAYQITGYDGFSRPVLQQSGRDASSGPYPSVANSYDWRGNVSWTSTPYMAAAGVGAVVHRQGYGLFNIQNPGSQTVSDPLGRTYAVQDAGGGTALYSYSFNDVLVMKGPAAPSETIKSVQYEYNGAGQLASVCEITSGAGSGACSQSTAATGYLTKYTYGGGLLSSIHQNVQTGSSVQETRSFAYDVLGRMGSQTLPETGTTTFSYDTDGDCSGTYIGDVVKKVDNAGNKTCFTYDNLHRLLSTAVVAGPNANVTPQNHYVYDAASMISIANGYTYTYSMQQANGTIAEAYTCNSAATPATCAANKITDIFQNSYIAGGAPQSQVWEKTPNSGQYYSTSVQSYANGAPMYLFSNAFNRELDYFLDSRGRLNDVQDYGWTDLVSTTYDPLFGTPSTVYLGNGETDTYTHDPVTGRPNSFTFNVPGAQHFTIAGSLAWNANGSLKQLSIADSSLPGSAANITCSYGTDELNRLSSVNCPNSWGQNLTYDPFGNITKDQNGAPNALTQTYAAGYNAVVANNRVSSGPTATYDANGNQTSANGTINLQWDAAARPVSTDSGAVTATYDAFGRVAEVNNGGSYAQYVYDPSGNKIAIMSSGALVKGIVALPGGATAIYDANGFSYFRHADWLGSSRLATNWDHTIHAKESYAPFGETYGESGTPDRSFTGQDQDAFSNMYDFSARRYDPVAGRFLSPDPSGLQYADLGDPQSFNLYAYVGNHPMIYTDPTGMNWFTTPNCGAVPAGQNVIGEVLNFLGNLFGGDCSGSGGNDSPDWIVNTLASTGGSVDPGNVSQSYDSTGGTSTWYIASMSVAPSNPVCGVQVKCRGIEYKHLGLLGAQHCDAQATDPSGVTHSLSGGPDGDPTNSTLNAWDTPSPTIPFTGMTVYNNPNSCSLAGCVINSTNQYHNSPGRPHYNGVSGPNSNTWLKSTFSGCGAGVPINTLGGIW